jgi:hypothetical protein
MGTGCISPWGQLPSTFFCSAGGGFWPDSAAKPDDRGGCFLGSTCRAQLRPISDMKPENMMQHSSRNDVEYRGEA